MKITVTEFLFTSTFKTTISEHSFTYDGLKMIYADLMEHEDNLFNAGMLEEEPEFCPGDIIQNYKEMPALEFYAAYSNAIEDRLGVEPADKIQAARDFLEHHCALVGETPDGRLVFQTL
jgi:hypothetical protein